MWSAQHSSTSSRKWRIFTWKNRIRFFITPHIENKLSQSQGRCWRRCGHSNADHSHIFWSCPKIKTFWEHVCLTVGKILGYKIPNNVMALYFCVLKDYVIIKKDQYLCKILLLACKKTITKNWYKTESPSLNQWMDKVKEICAMEKMTFCLRSRGVTFSRKWEKWITYIRGTEDATN